MMACSTCENKLAQEKFTELRQFVAGLENRSSGLIATLHKAQELFGYLPEEVQMVVAQELGVPASKVYGVVSFYSFFTMEPRGEHVVSVCLGTACYVRGSEKVLAEVEKLLNVKAGKTTADFKFSLDALRCVGACGLAPVMIVDGKVYGRVKVAEVSKILDKYR